MLTTKRLVLRRHEIADREGYLRLWGHEAPHDPNGVPTYAVSPEEAWSRLLRFVGHRTAFGFAPFLVTDRQTGNILGEAGYAYFGRGFGPDYDDVPEAMWKVAPDARGRGLASEAMAAATDWLDRTLPGDRTVCVIDPRNTPSMRIASRLHFACFGEVEYRSARRSLLERIRPSRR